MESLRYRIGSRTLFSAAACAVLLQSAGCDVGRSILVPISDASVADIPTTDVPATDAPLTDVTVSDGGMDVVTGDVPATDVPAVDAPATDVPATDVPATDVPATDVPATDVPATCSSVFATGFPMCSGQPSFWPCITALRSRLAGAELTRFNALATCVEAACGSNATEMCATTHCYEEVTSCHPICEFAASCGFSTCTGMSCAASFNRCGMLVSGAEATRFAAVRTCLERVCGASLDPTCVQSPSTEAACAAEISTCGMMAMPGDGGVPPADVPLPSDAPAMCAAGQSLCDSTCVSLQTSAAHCGVCNAACPAMTACVGGTCVGTGTCSPPQTQCGSSCVSLQTNAAHCGSCNHACTTGQTCVNGACVGTGDLRFTLTWDRPGDVDLHVTPPCGMNIFYPQANMLICGGTLDRDDTSGLGPENVFFGATAQRGEYLLCVIPFRIDAPTTATLRIFEGAVLRQSFTRMFASSMMVSECSRSSAFFVGAYTY
nr:hypothetical protein [Deltaproteobacteria bacterium]